MTYRRGLILFWDGRAGFADCEGAHFPLPRKPRLMGLDINEIEYMPRIHRHWVHVAGEPEGGRPLTKEEQAYIADALERMMLSGVWEICGDPGVAT